jgi:hypothetical protein
MKVNASQIETSPTPVLNLPTRAMAVAFLFLSSTEPWICSAQPWNERVMLIHANVIATLTQSVCIFVTSFSYNYTTPVENL